MFVHVLGLFDLFKKGKSLKDYFTHLQKLKEEEFNTLINIAALHVEDDKSEKALKYLEDALKIAREIGDKELEAFTFDSMGDVYFNERKMDIAIEYFKEAFRIYSSIKSPYKDEMRKKIKEAEKIKEAIEIARLGKERKEFLSAKKEKIEADIENVIPKLKILLNKVRSLSIYKSLKKDDALPQIKNALKIAREINDEVGKASLLLLLGSYSLEDRDYDKALDYLKDSEKLFQKLGDTKCLAIVNVFLGVIYYIKNEEKKFSDNFKNALRVFRELNDVEEEKITIDILNLLYGIQW